MVDLGAIQSVVVVLKGRIGTLIEVAAIDDAVVAAFERTILLSAVAPAPALVEGTR